MTHKLIFHQDQHGVHVYYRGMNIDYLVTQSQAPSCFLKINRTIDFDPSITCIVPPVENVTSTESKRQKTKWVNVSTKKTMTLVAYDSEYYKLKAAASRTHMTMEEEVAANVEFNRFEKEWQVESEDVDVITEFDFEVIDIDYPADERLIPLRHLGDTKINYFDVDGKKTALDMAHKLCQEAGLKFEDTYKRGTYYFPGYGGLDYWKIEGKTYGDNMEKIKLHIFTGDLIECRKYINEVERCVRSCFDQWVMSGKRPNGLTVGLVTEHLDKMASKLSFVETKIKTKDHYQDLQRLIKDARAEVIELDAGELKEE